MATSRRDFVRMASAAGGVLGLSGRNNIAEATMAPILPSQSAPLRLLILGGVTIPYERGLLGHSDADVLYHAVADCLLGAAAIGDLGTFFPDEPDLAGIDSALLLQRVVKRVWAEGYSLGNLDCTIIAEKPRLGSHIPGMRANLAQLLDAQADQISVKATTCDGLGSLGRSEGISARTTVLLVGKGG